jgi:hypothetical protein
VRTLSDVEAILTKRTRDACVGPVENHFYGAKKALENFASVCHSLNTGSKSGSKSDIQGGSCSVFNNSGIRENLKTDIYQLMKDLSAAHSEIREIKKSVDSARRALSSYKSMIASAIEKRSRCQLSPQQSAIFSDSLEKVLDLVCETEDCGRIIGLLADEVGIASERMEMNQKLVKAFAPPAVPDERMARSSTRSSRDGGIQGGATSDSDFTVRII